MTVQVSTPENFFHPNIEIIYLFFWTLLVLDVYQYSICLCSISLGTTGTWCISSSEKCKILRTSNLKLERDSLMCHVYSSIEFCDDIDNSRTEWKNNPVNLYRKTRRTRLIAVHSSGFTSWKTCSNEFSYVILKVQIVVLGEVGSLFLICWDFLKLKDICHAEKSMQELFQGYILQIPLFSRPEIHTPIWHGK